MSLAALPMHQHISVLNLMPVRLLVLTTLPTSSVFTNVTIGMGDDIHRRNASARMLSWGVISVFMLRRLSEYPVSVFHLHRRL